MLEFDAFECLFLETVNFKSGLTLFVSQYIYHFKSNNVYYAVLKMLSNF